MRGPGRILIPLLAVLVIVVLAGCGSGEETTSDSGSTDASTTSTSPVAGGGNSTSAKTAERRAKLPKGWKTATNKAGGFTIGLPPGWSSRPTKGGQGSIVVAPDDLITLTVTADRTSGALALPLEEFATRTAEALGSDVVDEADRFEDLFVTEAAPFKIGHGYEAAAVRASGTSPRTGAKELIFVVVVRRPEDAAYVVISRENAKHSKLASRDDVKEIIRSLRGQLRSGRSIGVDIVDGG